MSCPFKRLWASEPAAQDTKLDSQNVDLVSDSTTKLASVSLNADAENTSVKPDTQAATCPMGFGARADAPGDDGTAPAATCPLGFGSSSGPKLTNLHCMICKSFLYDCVITNCGHKYCRACISRFRDCPTCGADVITVEPEPEAQSVVESFLSAHAGDKSIWEIEGTAPTPSEHQENQQQQETDKAAFLLQIGVRALSGGNPASAAHRLQQCMDELNTQLENLEMYQESVENQEQQQKQVLQIHIIELLAKMGAVAGCLGDCFRALGDAPQAILEYTHSAELLERITSYSNPSTESKEILTTTAAASKSLSVTVNKIGEIYHLQGDLEKALEKYEEALLLRQARLHQIQVDVGGILLGQHQCRVTTTSVEAVLDVVVSHIKVANVLESILAEKKSEEEQGGVSKVVREEEKTEQQQQQRRWRQHEEMARKMLVDVETWIKKEEEKSSSVSDDIGIVVDDVRRKVDMLKSHLESLD